MPAPAALIFRSSPSISIDPHPEERRLRRVSKDEATYGPHGSRRARSALLTMRVRLIRFLGARLFARLHQIEALLNLAEQQRKILALLCRETRQDVPLLAQ